MKLQARNESNYCLNLPVEYIKWLLWEKGDDIYVNLKADTLTLELSCYAKSKLKEEILKKERAEESISRERDLRTQLQAYEVKISQLKTEIEERKLRKQVKTKESEVIKLEDEKRDEEMQDIEDMHT